MKFAPTRFSTVAATAIVAAASSGAHAAPFVPLVTNGIFENTTNFTDNTGDDTDSLSGGSTSITGWTVNPGHDVSWIGPGNTRGVTAEQGDYFLDLADGSPGGPFGGVSQTISTIPGHHYDLTFWIGSNGGASVDVTVGATTENFLNSLAGSNVWQLQVFQFIAAGHTTLLSFQGSSGGNYIGLDEVTVATTAPLPGTVLLLGTALAGLGFAGYRRRGQAPVLGSI